MTPERAETFRQQRDAIAAQAQLMEAAPEAERPSKPSALKAWLSQLRQLQELVIQMDALLAKNAPPDQRHIQPEAASEGDIEGTVILARIPKGRNAEMRISIKPWESRRVVDIRIWAMPKEGGEMKPSRKGIAFDAKKLDALIDSLHQAKQHV